jgi:hypothetical protein
MRQPDLFDAGEPKQPKPLRASPNGKSAAGWIGCANEYLDLIGLLRARKRELDISFETLDSVSGLPAGYSAKLLSKNPSRSIGLRSCGPLLQTLGVRVAVVVDPEALARVAKRLVPSKCRGRS